jgi:hypothetical protein
MSANSRADWPVRLALRRASSTPVRSWRRAADATETKHIAHVVDLAPAHQVVAAEPTVGVDHGVGRGSALADLRYDVGDFLDAAVRRIGAEQHCTTV